MHHLLLKGVEYEEKKTEQYSLYRCLTSKVLEYRKYPNVYKEIKAGFMPNVDIKSIDIHKALRYAAWGGHRWLVNNFYYTSKTTDRFDYYIDGACKGGHKDLVEYFLVRALQHRENQEFMHEYRENGVVGEGYNTRDDIKVEDKDKDKDKLDSKLDENIERKINKITEMPFEWYTNVIENSYLENPTRPEYELSFWIKLLRPLYNKEPFQVYQKIIQEWIHQYMDNENMYSYRRYLYKLEASVGNIDMIKAVFPTARQFEVRSIMVGAILGAQIDIIKYVETHSTLTIDDCPDHIAHSINYQKILNYRMSKDDPDMHEITWCHVLVGAADVSLETFKDIYNLYYNYSEGEIDMIMSDLICNDNVKAAMYLSDLHSLHEYEDYYDYLTTIFGNYDQETGHNKMRKNIFKLSKFFVSRGITQMTDILLEGVFNRAID